MYRVRIGYGEPLDRSAFDDYYTQTHLPLAGRIPGVQQFIAGRCESLDGAEPAFYHFAEIVFVDRIQAQAAFASAEGQAAVADIANFATGGATVIFANDDVALP